MEGSEVMTQRNRRKSKKPPIGMVIAVALEVALLGTLAFERSILGLVLCAAYSYFSASWSAFGRVFDSDPEERADVLTWDSGAGVLAWGSQAAFTGAVDHGQRRLVMMIAPDVFSRLWVVMAIEGSTDASGPDEVFADHAHKNVGKHLSILNAFAASEMFASTWLGGSELEQCDCGEIGGDREPGLS